MFSFPPHLEAAVTVAIKHRCNLSSFRERAIGRMVLATSLISKVALGEQRRGNYQPWGRKKPAVTSHHPFENILETRTVTCPENEYFVGDWVVLDGRKKAIEYWRVAWFVCLWCRVPLMGDYKINRKGLRKLKMGYCRRGQMSIGSRSRQHEVYKMDFNK